MIVELAATLAIVSAGGAGALDESAGAASAYGPGLYGNGLACGGRLTSSTVGVAHRSLPCGSRLRLCYRSSCQTVRVVDRGPFVRGRELDLTEATVRRFGVSSARSWGIRYVHWSRR